MASAVPATRWVACGLFGVLAAVGTSVATLVLLQVIEVLSEHNMPLIDIVTLESWRNGLLDVNAHILQTGLAILVVSSGNGFLACIRMQCRGVARWTTFHVGNHNDIACLWRRFFARLAMTELIKNRKTGLQIIAN